MSTQPFNSENQAKQANITEATREWWRALGFHQSGLTIGSPLGYEATRVCEQILTEHPPTSFKNTKTGETLTLEQLRGKLEEALLQAEASEKQRLKDAEKARRERGWKEINNALSAPDANEIIEAGEWAGFTKGEAFAWSWNLIQYEAYKTTTTKAMLRHRVFQKLAAGILPTEFAFPKRARALVDHGLTAQSYREHKEALNENTAA